MDDLHRLIVDLDRAASQALPEARQVVRKGALNVKLGAIRRITGHPHSPSYPRSIGFDEYALPGVLGARIGPDKAGRQGALGNILEYGTVNNPPLPHLGPAAEEEAPRFERALGVLGERLLDG